MTPSEAKIEGASPKKMGNEKVTRKASFKCSVPNKVTPQRIARKVVLPMSTVQALTFKFNELSQGNQTQKHKITQSAVKSMLAVNGKPNTIKVVICRKTSALKHKRTGEDVTVRRRVNVRKFEESKENQNVHRKISEYEDMKKGSGEEKRAVKMQVPKILVDIDLGSDNCSANHTVDNENSISVRTAISIFEKSSGSVVDKDKKNLEPNKFSTKEVKTKPIAAIKPILKKPEEVSGKKTKLSPKDSLNRKKYIAMKREATKEEDKPANENKLLENSSSLHKAGYTLITDEILLSEEKPQQQEPGSGNPNLKPNTSFLWSIGDKKSGTNRIDLPLPVPPENFIPDIEDDIYDDVRPISEESEEDFEDSEEETYDDVGVYLRNNENNKHNLEEDVREKNMRNASEALYDNPEKNFYSYDDGEGERYQYISDKTKTDPKENELELYQYIQNNNNNNINNSNNGNNIYEDIQSIKTQLSGKDKIKDIYEDVTNGSVINCYESVYNGIYSNQAKSSASDTSNNSGRSTYEKSNSLYGMSTGNDPATGHCINLTEVSESLRNSGYHLNLYNPVHPNSETSQSNSDEWVEVSDSDSEGTVYLVHERPRKVKTGGNSWSQKERRRWKRLQKKCNSNEEEVKLQNSEDHFYESVGQYENSEVCEENAKTLQPEQPPPVNKEQLYSEEQYIDDFDSQSSEDEAYIDTKLPDVPNHGYNITKSLKAAGQKLRKNFSLRKSDLSKSLKRFKKSSRPKLNEALFAQEKEIDKDYSPKTESPSTPTNPGNAIYFNSDSSSGSHNFTKSHSSSDVKSQNRRKSWTFRSKFKSSSSLDASENSQGVDSNRNSTFYLSLNEVETRKMEKKDELLSEIQTVLSQRNSNSSESVAEKDGTSRHSEVKVRPNVPPPPPPSVTKTETEKTKYSDILWGEKANSLYVESGLFDKQKKYSRCTDSDTSLYAEIGLYAASDELTSNRKTQMFVDEPLYQFYTECVNQRARDDILNNYDSEGYEEINDFYFVINEKRRTIDIKNVRPNFEDSNDDMRPKNPSFRSMSDRRTLWCQIPAVIDSCILETLSDQARKLQEAKFEILMSEGSYMNSLNVLEGHFMKKVGDLNIISKRDFRILFSNIVAVKKCSENFLEDLEKCWENNIMLNGICDIVYKHGTSSFHVYTKYCKNQVCIYRTLRELIDKNSSFENALKEIESDPICQNLNIHSFLMLPMQRITRLPLLVGAVLARLDKTDDEYDICKASFEVLNKIVQDCDDEARRMEKCEEMLILSQQIEFPKDIRRIPIITGSRFLVKSGQVTQLVNRDENKLTFGKKFSKVSLTLFLFTDLLIVAKKKNMRNYVVVDHCPRNLVQMQTTDGLSQLPVKLNANSDMGGKLLMLLTMLENHEKKTVEMILSFEMESDRQRWLEAVTPKLSENPDECIYEEWDCPQVISLYEFTPTQPDELNLCIGDVVNVLKKMNDGWYQGERLRDGARGWFPQNHTQEISSSHVRAKNKKLRYKLLALSGNLIDSHKINGK